MALSFYTINGYYNPKGMILVYKRCAGKHIESRRDAINIERSCVAGVFNPEGVVLGNVTLSGF